MSNPSATTTPTNTGAVDPIEAMVSDLVDMLEHQRVPIPEVRHLISPDEVHISRAGVPINVYQRVVTRMLERASLRADRQVSRRAQGLPNNTPAGGTRGGQGGGNTPWTQSMASASQISVHGSVSSSGTGQPARAAPRPPPRVYSRRLKELRKSPNKLFMAPAKILQAYGALSERQRADLQEEVSCSTAGGVGVSSHATQHLSRHILSTLSATCVQQLETQLARDISALRARCQAKWDALLAAEGKCQRAAAEEAGALEEKHRMQTQLAEAEAEDRRLTALLMRKQVRWENACEDVSVTVSQTERALRSLCGNLQVVSQLLSTPSPAVTPATLGNELPSIVKRICAASPASWIKIPSSLLQLKSDMLGAEDGVASHSGVTTHSGASDKPSAGSLQLFVQMVRDLTSAWSCEKRNENLSRRHGLSVSVSPSPPAVPDRTRTRTTNNSDQDSGGRGSTDGAGRHLLRLTDGAENRVMSRWYGGSADRTPQDVLLALRQLQLASSTDESGGARTSDLRSLAQPWSPVVLGQRIVKMLLRAGIPVLEGGHLSHNRSRRNDSQGGRRSHRHRQDDPVKRETVRSSGDARGSRINNGRVSSAGSMDGGRGAMSTAAVIGPSESQGSSTSSSTSHTSTTHSTGPVSHRDSARDAALDAFVGRVRDAFVSAVAEAASCRELQSVTHTHTPTPATAALDGTGTVTSATIHSSASSQQMRDSKASERLLAAAARDGVAWRTGASASSEHAAPSVKRERMPETETLVVNDDTRGMRRAQWDAGESSMNDGVLPMRGAQVDAESRTEVHAQRKTQLAVDDGTGPPLLLPVPSLERTVGPTLSVERMWRDSSQMQSAGWMDTLDVEDRIDIRDTSSSVSGVGVGDGGSGGSDGGVCSSRDVPPFPSHSSAHPAHDSAVTTASRNTPSDASPPLAKRANGAVKPEPVRDSIKQEPEDVDASIPMNDQDTRIVDAASGPTHRLHSQASREAACARANANHTSGNHVDASANITAANNNSQGQSETSLHDPSTDSDTSTPSATTETRNSSCQPDESGASWCPPPAKSVNQLCERLMRRVDAHLHLCPSGTCSPQPAQGPVVVQACADTDDTYEDADMERDTDTSSVSSRRVLHAFPLATHRVTQCGCAVVRDDQKHRRLALELFVGLSPFLLPARSPDSHKSKRGSDAEECGNACGEGSAGAANDSSAGSRSIGRGPSETPAPQRDSDTEPGVDTANTNSAAAAAAANDGKDGVGGSEESSGSGPDSRSERDSEDANADNLSIDGADEDGTGHSTSHHGTLHQRLLNKVATASRRHCRDSLTRLREHLPVLVSADAGASSRKAPDHITQLQSFRSFSAVAVKDIRSMIAKHHTIEERREQLSANQTRTHKLTNFLQALRKSSPSLATDGVTSDSNVVGLRPVNDENATHTTTKGMLTRSYDKDVEGLKNAGGHTTAVLDISKGVLRARSIEVTGDLCGNKRPRKRVDAHAPRSNVDRVKGGAFQTVKVGGGAQEALSRGVRRRPRKIRSRAVRVAVPSVNLWEKYRDGTQEWREYGVVE